MKFSIEKSKFEIILNNLQPFLDKKDSSQITSHIYLETHENTLILKATDYEIGLETQINIKKEIDGNATVSGKRILDSIKRLKDKEISIETNGQNLYIKQEETSFELPMFDANEFPKNIQETTQNKINFDTSSFIQFLKKITPAIDSSNQKPELTGALLDLKDYTFNFVGTDTRRLAIVKQKIQSLEKLNLIIPKKAINEILKLFSDEIEIFYNEYQLIIKNQYYTFFTKLINGNFPDYEKIIAKDFRIQTKLPKQNFLESIKIINSISQKIKITFRSNEILFETIQTDNTGKANTQFEYQTNFEEEMNLCVDSRYIIDFLSQIENTEFELCINEAKNPFVLKDGDFSTLILPIQN